MLNDLMVVAGSVLTLFFMMAVGYILGKRGFFTKQTLSQLSSLLLYIVAPAIMIDTFLAQEANAETLRLLLAAAAALIVTYVLNAVLIQFCFRRSGPEDRGVLRFAAIYGNTGFMGIPLIQAVLGNDGMITAVVCCAVFNVFIWTHGCRIMGVSSSWKKALVNPGTVGLALALAFFFLPAELPSPLTSAISFVGSLNTPLAMIVIGAQMADVDLGSIFREGRLYVLSAVKLILVPLITMLVLVPFHLESNIYVGTAILAACPVAGASSLFCQLGGRDTSLSARLVTLTTLFSIVTLPLMGTLARTLYRLV